MRRFIALFILAFAALSTVGCADVVRDVLRDGRPYEAGNLPPGKTLSNDCYYKDGKIVGENCKLEDLKPGQYQAVVGRPYGGGSWGHFGPPGACMSTSMGPVPCDSPYGTRQWAIGGRVSF